MIRHHAHQAKELVKEKGEAMAGDLKERGEEYAAQRKDRVAERIERYGDRFDEAAESFEGEDPNIAWLTHRAAERLTHLAEHVRERDFRSLWRDAEGMARKHPLAFTGGMFVAGVALGSFLRAARSDYGSSDGDEQSWPGEAWDETPSELDEQLAASPGPAGVREY